jgi:CelD/BcsL family acetyltransferase involved in cellulose biosynthesis
MRMTRIAPHEIDAGVQARWRSLQDHPERPEWQHPFLSAELARLTGEVRPASRVAVIEDAGRVVGLWAFELQWPEVARPLARHMSDLQAPLLDPDWVADQTPRAALGLTRPASDDVAAPWGAGGSTLTRLAGLRIVQYDHLLVAAQGIDLAASIGDAGAGGHAGASTPAGNARSLDETWRVGWMIDLRQGYPAYRRLQDRQTRWWRRASSKARRIVEAMGPLSLSDDIHDDEAWHALARWKSSQYRQSGLRDNFSIAWVREWLERLRWTDTPHLKGVLHALRAGGRLVAVNFGLRGGNILHHYLPAYDARVAVHTPGHLLLAQLVEQVAAEGVHWIDFSTGDMEFKQSVSNAQRPLAQGVVAPHWVRRLRHWTHQADAGLRALPGLRPVARQGRRALVALANGPSPWLRPR